MSQPNLLLIFTDQQRFDALGAYGNPAIHTPNLDRLAAQGALFTNCISPSPLCVPARACCVTGHTASRIGCLDNGLPKNARQDDALPALLAGAGYVTKAIGKMHFSNKGYERTYGMQSMELSEEMRGCRFPQDAADVVFDDYDRYLMERGLFGWEKPPEIGYNEIKPVLNGMPPEHHVTRWCGDRTVNWLKNERPKDKPFFLWTSFVKPHVPYDCPVELRDFYDPGKIPPAARCDTDTVDDNPILFDLKARHEFDLYSEKANRMAKAFYYANITLIDKEIGRILDTLRDEGLEDNTVVLFTADHGDMMGDHGLWYKSYGYEGSVHIPMLLRGPGVPAGIRVDDIVSLLDVYPTLLSSAGVPFEGRPGSDLKAYLPGSRAKESDFCLAEMFFPPNYAIHARSKRFKYLYYQNGGREELFDLSADPNEFHNVAGDPAYAAGLADMRERSIAWIKRNGDPAYALDGDKLRAEPLKRSPVYPALGDAPRPFSRMPWELRTPPSNVPEKRQGWYWRATGGDYSVLLRDALKRAGRDDV